MMEHAVDVDRYCSEAISLLLLMQCKDTLTHIWRSASQASGGAHLTNPEALQTPTSHTLAGKTQTKAWIRNARPQHSYSWKLLN